MSFINRFAVLGTMLLSFLFLSPAQAESACKGVGKSSCGAKSSCTWVDGYKRKDGVSVKAHCRTVSKKSTKDKKTSSKDKRSTKDTKKAADKKKPKKDAGKKSKKKTKKQPEKKKSS